MAAMKSISHASMNQTDWFEGVGNFLQLRPPIHIIRQESSEKDLQVLCGKLGLTMIKMPSDSVSTHRNSYAGIPSLSEKGRRNIEHWYAQDMELYRICDAWIEDSVIFSKV